MCINQLTMTIGHNVFCRVVLIKSVGHGDHGHSALASSHAVLGWIIVALCLLQPVLILVASRKQPLISNTHRAVGFIVLALAHVFQLWSGAQIYGGWMSAGVLMVSLRLIAGKFYRALIAPHVFTLTQCVPPPLRHIPLCFSCLSLGCI